MYKSSKHRRLSTQFTSRTSSRIWKRWSTIGQTGTRPSTLTLRPWEARRVQLREEWRVRRQEQLSADHTLTTNSRYICRECQRNYLSHTGLHAAQTHNPPRPRHRFYCVLRQTDALIIISGRLYGQTLLYKIVGLIVERPSSYIKIEQQESFLPNLISHLMRFA